MEALQTSEEAIKLDPKNWYAYYTKGVSLRWLGKLEDALEAYQKALEISPANEAVMNQIDVINYKKAHPNRSKLLERFFKMK